MALASRLVRHRDGVPIYGYPSGPGTPPVAVVRAAHDEVRDRGRHIHDFPALWFVPGAATVFVAAAGEVLDPGRVDRSDGIGVYFDPAALASDGARPTWREHPLLFPFVHGEAGGMLELRLPGERLQPWQTAIASIEAELTERRDGYRQAALAHLTLLLIDLARVADDVVGDLRHSGEPLLAEVFAVIDRRLDQPLSLRDVAADVGITPGHLTTIVRRRTGRTVQDWITERRMTESRRLLAETDLPIAEVARRVGIADPGYFSRLFRRVHGTAPRTWRTRPC
ncbi:helix-turn-helix transcriptional regulator [Mycolicibacterium flavescens]|uniref:AraC family transcriptional regulator n=1 Tax=Mycolicibacterium flavescens TaxID=1776 RepID=A0A1E3RKT6_MYCFV|nr:AraC family transcriptional regulator [Mycolicibacterium flavescens]MCV7278967.1 helix-turn-helix transcriptional regulator [Mycolicibacterium flavescens]ODQ90468.1 AraC family transcriptional regulator [Mycolicibacterium flavescens]